MNEELIIRDAIPADLPLIYDSWKKSFRYDSGFGRSFTGFNDVYNSNYNKVIEHIILDEQTFTKIACLKNEPKVILGYIVFNTSTLHYIFIKEAFRNKFKIFEGLMGLIPGLRSYTHRTSHFDHKMKSYGHLIYNPFSLFHTEEQINGTSL